MKKTDRTTAFEGGPYVPGVPAGCEITYMLSGEDAKRYRDILEITPSDQNPVFYWHQVAMDAIKSAESDQKRAKLAEELRDRAERELNAMTSGLVARTADKRALIPLDMSRLIDMAATGAIDLNVSLFISKGKENA